MAVDILQRDDLKGATGHRFREVQHDDVKSLPGDALDQADRGDPGMPNRLERRARHARAHVASQRLARALAGLTGMKAVADRSVRAVASALGARIASLAVRESTGERLAMVAAVGYPLSLVEHVRVPGSHGVLRTVYESRVPLRVADVTQIPGVDRNRPRYSTSSCMAWPLLAGSDLIGILCVSDRLDRRPFTPDDLSTLRAFAAPITLALSREHARTRAEALAHAAAVDPLSGLFNRRYFYRRLSEELERARRQSVPTALAMLDLDSFKPINDRLGHLTGDTVIREIADLLLRSIRVFDVCTRFGGDEFAIVMPGSSYEAATRVAERIREHICAYAFGGRHELHLTASVGVAVATSDMPATDLIAQADRALYLAKRMGKNRVSTPERIVRRD